MRTVRGSDRGTGTTTAGRGARRQRDRSPTQIGQNFGGVIIQNRSAYWLGRSELLIIGGKASYELQSNG